MEFSGDGQYFHVDFFAFFAFFVVNSVFATTKNTRQRGCRRDAGAPR
jgi:hypothetical protein